LLSRGDIHYHPEFQFEDGTSSKKLLVLLNTPGDQELFLFLKTTSQRKNKPKVPGCIETYPPLFFLPAKVDFFDQDTWIQLYQIYPIHPIDFGKDKRFVKVGTLKPKTLKTVIDCLLKTQDEDIPNNIKRMLRPKIDESIVKLKKHFMDR